MNFKKITAAVVLNCFLLSFVYGQAAAYLFENSKENYKAIISDLMLPYNYGQITDSYFSGSDRLIIYIQDLHCHAQVQKNISNIIGFFDKKTGVSNIYLEGVFGDISTQWLVQPNNVLANKMIDAGKLTGAEYYSAVSGKTEIIKGLENKQAYFENLKRFGKIIDDKDKIDILLKALDQETSNLKSKYYQKRQFKLEKLSEDYKNGRISGEKYFKLLVKHVDKLGIDLSKYKNMSLYMRLLFEQKNINFDSTAKEIRVLASVLKQKLSYYDYKKLLEITDNFSEIGRLYSSVSAIDEQYGININRDFPEITKYFSYIELSRKINPLELVSEEVILTNEISSRFAHTRSQREVAFIAHFERYIKDCLKGNITELDYKYYIENIDVYKKLRSQYADSRVFSLVSEYLSESEKFYTLNNERNKYFIENIFKNIDAEQQMTNAQESVVNLEQIMRNPALIKRADVVITGGFHTAAISEILKEKNISYIVITPNVKGGTKSAERLYHQIAKEQAAIPFQTLAVMALSLQVMILKEQGVSLEKIKETLNAQADLMPIIEAAFNGNIHSVDKDKLSAEIEKLNTEVQLAKMLDSDISGNIKENIAKMLGIELSLLDFIDIDKLSKFWEENNYGFIETLKEDAAIRQRYNENKILAEVLVIFNDIAGEIMLGKNIINCAAHSVYDVFSPVAKSNEALAALLIKTSDILLKANPPDGTSSMFSVLETLKSKGYRAYHADFKILTEALGFFKPVIAAVSSNGKEGEINHYITITRISDGNSVVIRDSAAGVRFVSYDDLENILIEEYGWKNDKNIVLSGKLDNLVEIDSDNLRNIYGATQSKNTESEKSLSEKHIKAAYFDSGAMGHENFYLEDLLEDENAFYAKIKKASDSNKILIIRMFRKAYNSENLSNKELLKKYKEVKKLIKRFADLEKIFPDNNKIFQLRPSYGAGFFLSEMLKNAFVHGNHCQDEPIIVRLKEHYGEISLISVYNAQKDSQINENRKKLAVKAGLTGYHIGGNIMMLNNIRTFKSGLREISGMKFYVASSNLRGDDVLKYGNSTVKIFFDKHPALAKIASSVMDLISVSLKLIGIIWPPLLLMNVFGNIPGLFLTVALAGISGIVLKMLIDGINKRAGQYKKETFKQKFAAWMQINQISAVIISEWQIHLLSSFFMTISDKIWVAIFSPSVASGPQTENLSEFYETRALFENNFNDSERTFTDRLKFYLEALTADFMLKILNVAGYDSRRANNQFLRKIIIFIAEIFVTPALIVKWLSSINSVPENEITPVPVRSQIKYFNDQLNFEAVEKTKQILNEFRHNFKSNLDYIERYMQASKERVLTESEKNMLAVNMKIVASAVEILLMDSIYFDSYTKGHAEHVAADSVLIARNINSELTKKYEPYFEDYVKIVALLHDIGKNAILDEVLNKPGKLSDSDFELMQQHSSIGGEILADTGFGFAANDVNAHHEKYDGSGYGQKLAGSEISIPAAVVALADSYDSMSRDRVYRKALPEKEIINDVKSNKEKQFNPFVVDAFLKTVKKLIEMRSNEELDIKKKIWIAQIIQAEIIKGRMSPDELNDLIVLMTQELSFKDKDAICKMIVFDSESGKANRYRKFKVGYRTYSVYGIFDNTLRYGQYTFESVKNAIYGGLTTSEKNARASVDKNSVTGEWLEKITRYWSVKAKKKFLKLLKIKDIDPVIYSSIEENKNGAGKELTLSDIIDMYAAIDEINTGISNELMIEKINNFSDLQRELLTKKIINMFDAFDNEVKIKIYGLIGVVIFGDERYFNIKDVSDTEFENIVKTFASSRLNSKITVEALSSLKLPAGYKPIKDILMDKMQLRKYRDGLYANNIFSGNKALKNIQTDISSFRRNPQYKQISICLVSSENDNISKTGSLILKHKLDTLGIGSGAVKVAYSGIFNSGREFIYNDDYAEILYSKGIIGDKNIYYKDEFVPPAEYKNFEYFIAAGEKHRQYIINDCGVSPDKVIVLSELAPDVLKGEIGMTDNFYAGKRKVVNLFEKIFEISFNRRVASVKMQKNIQNKKIMLNFIFKFFGIFNIKKVSGISIKVVTYSFYSGKNVIKNREALNISENLIVAEDEQQAAELREQGFNCITVEYSEKRRNGEKLGILAENKKNGAIIRGVWDARNKKIWIYSNDREGLKGIEPGLIKKAIVQMQDNGRNFKIFKGIRNVIIPEGSADISSVLNKMLNRQKDSITRPGKEINLDASDNMAAFSSLCENAFAEGIRMITINYEQEKNNKKTIKEFRALGMKFLVAAGSKYGVNVDFNGALKFDADGLFIDLTDISYEQQIELIAEAENFISTQIKYRKYKSEPVVYVKGLSEKFENIDIHLKYGVMPVFENTLKASQYCRAESKKYIIEMTSESKTYDIDGILNNNDVYGIMADEDGFNKIKNRSVISDTINEIFKPKTYEQLFESEMWKVRNSKQKFEIEHIEKQLERNSVLSEFLSEIGASVKDTQKAKEWLTLILDSNILSGFAESRTRYLFEAGRYAEAVGCVKGSVMNSVESNFNLKPSDAKAYLQYMDGRFRDVRTLIALKLIMSGKKLAELKQESGFIDSDMTADEYLNAVVLKEINSFIRLSMKEYSVQPVSDTAEIERMADMFNKFDIFANDRFRQDGIIEKIEISQSAVKKILGAA